MTIDEALCEAIKLDWRTAALSERERVMLEYAEKVTRRATSVTPEDLQGLRRVGYDDQAILQINLITAYFNYFNRVADGLGVGRPA